VTTTTGPNRRTVLCGLAAALAAPGALAACSSDPGEFQPGTPTQAAPQHCESTPKRWQAGVMRLINVITITIVCLGAQSLEAATLTWNANPEPDVAGSRWFHSTAEWVD